MGKVQYAIMQNLVHKMAEANQYDMEKIDELHRGSVVFRDELQGIMNSSVNIRNRQSEFAFMSPMQNRRTNIPSKLDAETDKWAHQEEQEDELDIPISDKGSDQDNDKDSDLSFEPD